jgi:rhamnosyltransferase
MPFEPNHPQPTVSVGILTRNAGKPFAKVIDALRSQQTSWPYEIVLLDSASRDGTDTLGANNGARVIPYRPKKFRFGAARDELFGHCRGQVIVTLSQDVLPAHDRWLAALAAPILDGRADACVGPQDPPPGQYTFYWDYNESWMRSIAIRFDQAYGRIAISCADLALRRSTWEALRFGDVEAIEDRVMQVKLFEGGHKMLYVEEALSYHGHDYTWREICNRNGSFAMGWAMLGWPYTAGRLLRDLTQPSRYRATVEAFMQRKLVSWKELVFPFAMCFIQYWGSRKKQWS